MYSSCLLKKTIFWATEIFDQISVLQSSYMASMATKHSIMKQSIVFWVIGHRLSFDYGLKKFLFGAWRNFSGALRELILNSTNLTLISDILRCLVRILDP